MWQRPAVSSPSKRIGLASPAVAPLGPLPICDGARARMSDPHGVQLSLATLPGGDHEIRSEEIESVLHADCATARLPGLLRQARRIFSGVVPPHARRAGSVALVPDLAATIAFPDTYERLRPGARRPAPRWAGDHVQQHLFDVKAFGRGVAHYRCALARDVRAGAAEDYARRVHGEYEAHARRIDHDPHPRGHGVAAGAVGPVEQRLRSFPRTHGLAFGGHGECSGAVDALRRRVAQGQAAARWRTMGARSEAEARGVLLGRLRQRWGVTACRAQAEHRLRRLWAVGGRREDRRPLQYEDAGEPGRAAREAVHGAGFGGARVRGGGAWAGHRGGLGGERPRGKRACRGLCGRRVSESLGVLGVHGAPIWRVVSCAVLSVTQVLVVIVK